MTSARALPPTSVTRIGSCSSTTPGRSIWLGSVRSSSTPVVASTSSSLRRHQVRPTPSISQCGNAASVSPKPAAAARLRPRSSRIAGVSSAPTSPCTCPEARPESCSTVPMPRSSGHRCSSQKWSYLLAESHRGGFGDIGGDAAGALIERTFRERIILVGVTVPPHRVDDVERSLDELALLVDTAGADTVGRINQRRDSPDAATFVGKGKAHEIRELSEELDSDTVVFDDELTPAQQFNLEKLLGRTAIDRTAVILDIFAQNAHSQEGKAQVELALLRYRLPRLRGRGKQLSQQAGGMSAAGGARIGSRGPGETQ